VLILRLTLKTEMAISVVKSIGVILFDSLIISFPLEFCELCV
jgi:hypothetical protein